MCDHSLIGVPNRLANEGEELVVHRFPRGSMGLVPSGSPSRASNTDQTGARGFWQTIKNLFRSEGSNQFTAVCVPPGARLLLRDIPEGTQRAFKICQEEEVMFTQLSAEANTYRDAIRFNSGTEMLLQKLREGQRIRVLDLDAAEPPVESIERTTGAGKSFHPSWILVHS